MSMINVKTEIMSALEMVQRLGGSSKVFIGKTLRAVGSKGVSAVKKGFRNHLKIKSGRLKKDVRASLARNKMAVSVYSSAQNKTSRYGFILAARGNDWFESEVYRFSQSSEFQTTVQKVLDKEVSRLVKK